MKTRRKPDWLKIKLPQGKEFKQVQRILEEHQLHTICVSGKCPNMAECWAAGTATFMILGEICTRSCKFCNTQTGRPLALDTQEPANTAKAVQLLKLKHAVITSVDRDDLPDLGAAHWAETIRAVKEVNPNTTLEVLIPDFQGKLDLLDVVIAAQPDIISHNIETVERLTPQVRSAAKYRTSLKIVGAVGASGIRSKSGLMLGLGETEEEVLQTMDDLRTVDCQVLTIGQYLQPTKKHLEVQEYVSPKQFEEYKRIGLEKGFDQVESGALVRSSYHASKHLKKSADK